MNCKSAYTILFFLLIMILGADAAVPDSSRVQAWDNAVVDYRAASVETMEAYKQMEEYSYDRYNKPESWWSKFKRWLLAQIIYSGLSSNIVLFGLIALAVFILLFVILKLLGVRISGLFIFTHNSKVTNLIFKQGDDDIYDENMVKILTAAIDNKAYREAVRVMYLLSLRHLDQLELIEWKPWKTNREYYFELVLTEHKHLFKTLLRSYEYIWYGQFSVDEDQFAKVKADFDHFERMVGNVKISA